MQLDRFPLRPLTAAVALVCGVFSTGAWADDPNPYYIGASEAITHDSNVFRGPTGQERSDTYSSTGLLGGIDQPFGRQHFYAKGSVRYNKFRNQDSLNNTGYGLTTGLDLSTIGHLSGSLTYTANQSLYNYGGFSTVSLTARNIEKSQQASGRLSWGMSGKMSLDGNYSHQSLRYSATAYNFANLDQDMGSIGLTYRPSGLLSVGAALRATHADYPQAGYSFNRDDIDLTTTWVPTGQSTVNGRISYGRLKYSNALDSNSITSGSVSWDYRPTGKLGFVLWASRDTGAQSSFFNFASLAGGTQTAVGDNSQRTSTFAVTTSYAATGKISLTASGRYVRRTLNNSIVFTGTGSQSASGGDINKVLSLGANYQALRNVVFACNIARDTRSSSGVLSFPYRDTTYGCSGQITLQ